MCCAEISVSSSVPDIVSSDFSSGGGVRDSSMFQAFIGLASLSMLMFDVHLGDFSAPR